MNRSVFQRKLEKVCRGKVLFGELLSEHTSLGIGGPAEALVCPADIADLQRVLTLAKKEAKSILVIGRGTNLLVSDAGVPGLVLRVNQACSEINTSDGQISAGAGVELPRLLQFCLQQGLGGLEFAAGIPGTVGGAVKGNAGILKAEISDPLVEVDTLNVSSLEFTTLKKNQITFEYRRSSLPKELILTEITFQFYPEDPMNVKTRIEDYLKTRLTSQPVGEKCAGCVFKNPLGYSAGQLIEQAGCKGMSCGDAVVSELHANFIINRGKARASDVLKLIENIRERVRSTTGVELELEIEMVG
ncbi:MAG: UDP-N-acetylmuramate dehydrogenase [Candidatus Latescibacteria bacterium]|nr:UDP-N-acetylmuramate dehydrogenase [Candidatus Latescibacterota bacterium]